MELVPGTITPIGAVYPSSNVSVWQDNEAEPGYKYTFQDLLKYENGESEYGSLRQSISFVKRNEDGSWEPGLQSEHLLIALIDRHKKLNAKFASREGALAITKMEEALMWLEARVKERIQRGVMSKLEK